MNISTLEATTGATFFKWCEFAVIAVTLLSFAAFCVYGIIADIRSKR